MDSLSAILKGISPDGGLFVPEAIPGLSMKWIESMAAEPYEAFAAKIMGMYFDIPHAALEQMVREAYLSFDDSRVAPIAAIGEHEFVLELFHGPTLAFKDMALQMLPRLISYSLSAREAQRDILILTATSGDTGKAALEGFADVPRTRIAVFYPSGGVSHMQKLQMTTQQGHNTYVAAVRGNFDDAQTGVKRLFADPDFCEAVRERGYELSSANSINIGRLIPQIVYYIYSYAKMAGSGAISPGEKINIVVPTGNFGNILAAYYAMEMGLPVAKLICASNKNNVLTDFFDSGRYFAGRTFFKTLSPSMDILISSNLERLLFEISGRDSLIVRELMELLAAQGDYQIRDEMLLRLRECFYADFADDPATTAAIARMFKNHGYLMDTHTGVAQAVYDNYLSATGDTTPTLLVSTASPYKFAQDVYQAISGKAEEDPFVAAEKLSDLSETRLPGQIEALRRSRVRFTDVVDRRTMAEAVLSNL